MIMLANLLHGVGLILGSLIWFVNILIIAAVVMSWVSADPRNPLVQFVRSTTEPLFYRARKYIPPMGMIDISPIVILLSLQLINSFIVESMLDYAQLIKASAMTITN